MGASRPSDNRVDSSVDAYVQALRNAQLRGSIGRIEDCADDAAMERFLSVLQHESHNRQRWATRGQFRLAHPH